VAGHPEEQAPQVKQRFRFPPSGRSSLTWSINLLFFFPPSLIASSAMLSNPPCHFCLRKNELFIYPYKFQVKK
jgi:hypothetical protein